MRGIRTLQPDQSVIADTLALKASSWFRQNLARGESTGCPLLVSGVRHLRLSAAIKSSKQNALSAKTIILSDSQGHVSTTRIGIRYTRRL